jgi:hypothetical protein
MLVSAFIANEVRAQIKDDVATYRWSDAALIAAINTQRRTLYGDHPEAFYVTDILTACPADLTATTDTIDVVQEYIEGLREMVCRQIFAEDSEDTGNMAVAKVHDGIAEGLVE